MTKQNIISISDVKKVIVLNKVGNHNHITGIQAASFKYKECYEEEVAAFFKAMNIQRMSKMHIIFNGAGEAHLTAVATFADVSA